MKRAKSAATQPHNNARSGQSQGDRGGRRGGFFTRGLSAHELRHTQHEEETKGATTSTPRPDEPVEPRSPIGRMVHVEEEESSDTEQENENDDMARPLFEHLLVVRNGDINADGTDRAILCSQFPRPGQDQYHNRAKLPDDMAEFCLPMGHDVNIPEGDFFIRVMTGQDAERLYIGFLYFEGFPQIQENNEPTIERAQSTSKLPYKDGIDSLLSRPRTLRQTQSAMSGDGGESYHSRNSSGNTHLVPSKTGSIRSSNRKVSEVFGTFEGSVPSKHGVVIALVSRYLLPYTMRSLLRDLYEQYVEPINCFSTTPFDCMAARTCVGRPNFEEIANKICTELQWGSSKGQREATVGPVCGREIAMISKEHKGNQLFNITFSTLFSCISYETYMTILYCLLHEKSLLLRSFSQWRLGACCEALRLSLHPLQWVNVYVPVVPSGALDVIDSPVPAIIGVLTHLSLEANFEDGLQNFLVVDLDRNVIESRPDITRLDEFLDIMMRHRAQTRSPSHGNPQQYHTAFSRALAEIKRCVPPPSNLLHMSLTSMQEISACYSEGSEHFVVKTYGKAKALLDDSFEDTYDCMNVVFLRETPESHTVAQRRMFNSVPCLLQNGTIKLDNGSVTQFDLDLQWGIHNEMKFHDGAKEPNRLPPWYCSQRWEWVSRVHTAMKQWLEKTLQPLTDSSFSSDGRASSLILKGLESTMLATGYMEHRQHLKKVSLSKLPIIGLSRNSLVDKKSKYLPTDVVAVRDRFPFDGRTQRLSALHIRGNSHPSQGRLRARRRNSDSRLIMKTNVHRCQIEYYERRIKELKDMIGRLMREQSKILGKLRQVTDERISYRERVEQLERSVDQSDKEAKKMKKEIKQLKDQVHEADNKLLEWEEKAQEQEYYIDSLHELIADIPTRELQKGSSSERKSPRSKLKAPDNTFEPQMFQKLPIAFASTEQSLEGAFTDVRRALRNVEDIVHKSKTLGYSRNCGTTSNESLKETVHRSIEYLEECQTLFRRWLQDLKFEERREINRRNKNAGGVQLEVNSLNGTPEDREDPQMANSDKLAILKGKLDALEG